jgi:hypothetical protein
VYGRGMVSGRAKYEETNSTPAATYVEGLCLR